MHVFYIDDFHFSLPERHRFPLEKYILLRRAIEAQSWSPDLTWRVPDPASPEQLALAHSPDYIRRVRRGELSNREIRRLGLPWSPQLVERSRRSVGGSIFAARAAVQDGIALHLGGGTHHAGYEHGEGFCIFNDSVIAARVVQREHANVRKIAILDCDVHQGNGTAAITAEDDTIFTFSIHGQKNFPYRKFPSNLDIGLADATENAAYLEYLEEGVDRALGLSNPDLVIYLAGADPFIGDRLGRLSLTKSGLAARDHLVFRRCREAGIPVAIVLSGVYGREILDTVDIHLNTARSAYLAHQQLHRSDIPT